MNFKCSKAISAPNSKLNPLARCLHAALLLMSAFFTISLCVPRGALANPTQAASDPLLSAVNDALDEKITDAKKRFEIVEQIEAKYDQPSNTPSANSRELLVKAHFVAAVTHFYLNEFDACEKRLAAVHDLLKPSELPEMWFRYRSLSAALGLVQGKREESLKAYGDLLANDLQGIPAVVVERARINYAAALHETVEPRRPQISTNR